MRLTSLKFVSATLLLSSAIIYLAVAGIQAGSVYSVSVDRYLEDAQFHNQRVRLHGKVGKDHFQSSPGKLSAQFEVLGKSQSITVAYTGAIPDLFKTGCDVVVEGRADAAGVFHSDLMMTKCASKYEPGSPHANVDTDPAQPKPQSLENRS